MGTIPTITLYKGSEIVNVNHGDTATKKQFQALGYSTKKPAGYVPPIPREPNTTPAWELQTAEFESAWYGWREYHNFIGCQLPPQEIEKQLRTLELQGAKNAVVMLKENTCVAYKRFLCAEYEFKRVYDASCDKNLEREFITAHKQAQIGYFDWKKLSDKFNAINNIRSELLNVVTDEKLKSAVTALLRLERADVVRDVIQIWKSRIEELKPHVEIVQQPRIGIPADILMIVSKRVVETIDAHYRIEMINPQSLADSLRAGQLRDLILAIGNGTIKTKHKCTEMTGKTVAYFRGEVRGSKHDQKSKIIELLDSLT